MAITLVGTPGSAFTAAVTNTITVNLPLGGTSPASATIVLAFCAQYNSGSPGFNTPSGWTAIPGTAVVQGVAAAAGFYQLFAGGAAIPATQAFTTIDAGGGNFGCMTVAYQGHNTSTPWDVENSSSSTIAAASIAIPSVTTAVVNDQVIQFGNVKGDTGAGSNPIFSTGTKQIEMNRTTTGAAGYSALGDYSKAVAGATGAQTLSWTGNSIQPSIGVIAALQAAAAATGMPGYPPSGLIEEPTEGMQESNVVPPQ